MCTYGVNNMNDIVFSTCPIRDERWDTAMGGNLISLSRWRVSLRLWFQPLLPIVEMEKTLIVYFNTSMARRIRARVSSFPRKVLISYICGPFPSPTSVKRQAFMMLPIL